MLRNRGTFLGKEKELHPPQLHQVPGLLGGAAAAAVRCALRAGREWAACGKFAGKPPPAIPNLITIRLVLQLFAYSLLIPTCRLPGDVPH